MANNGREKVYLDGKEVTPEAFAELFAEAKREADRTADRVEYLAAIARSTADRLRKCEPWGVETRGGVLAVSAHESRKAVKPSRYREAVEYVIGKGGVDSLKLTGDAWTILAGTDGGLEPWVDRTQGTRRVTFRFKR